jgi:histone-lysine N-methyltransferase SETMAR
LPVHADNVRPHVPTRVKQYVGDHSLGTALHPPYSLDLAPSDFFLFGHAKRVLQGSEFQSLEKLSEAVVRILNAIPIATLIGTFHEWIKRNQAYIDNSRKYVE